MRWPCCVYPCYILLSLLPSWPTSPSSGLFVHPPGTRVANRIVRGCAPTNEFNMIFPELPFVAWKSKPIYLGSLLRVCRVSSFESESAREPIDWWKSTALNGVGLLTFVNAVQHGGPTRLKSNAAQWGTCLNSNGRCHRLGLLAHCWTDLFHFWTLKYSTDEMCGVMRQGCELVKSLL